MEAGTNGEKSPIHLKRGDKTVEIDYYLLSGQLSVDAIEVKTFPLGEGGSMMKSLSNKLKEFPTSTDLFNWSLNSPTLTLSKRQLLQFGV
jgi:hypothetical protein